MCGCSACGRYRDARRTRAAAVINLRSGAPLVEVDRSGVVESVHPGHLVVLDAGGEVIDAVGAPAQPIFPRSSLKPLQAVGMLRAGLPLSSAELALAASSHSGSPRHVAVDRRHAGSGRPCRGRSGLPAGPAVGRGCARRVDRSRRGSSGGWR